MCIRDRCMFFYCFYNCYLVHLLVLVEILGKHLLHHHGFPYINTSNWGPHAIYVCTRQISIYSINKYLSKAAKILEWQFFWSICDTSFNLPPYANYTACCLLCQRWDHCDQHLVTPDRNRLAPEMVEDLVMLKCNLRLLRNMSTVWKTYLLCLVWLRSDIQYICTYLGKPVLIWENNIWTSGFWFLFSDVF